MLAHDRAMLLAAKADQAEAEDTRKYLLLSAAEYENIAARSCEPQEHITHAVLHRSAATLYLQAGRPGEALEVIANWLKLRQNPPLELCKEIASVARKAVQIITKGGAT